MKKFIEGVEYRAEFLGETSAKSTARIISRTDCYITYEWHGHQNRCKVSIDPLGDEVIDQGTRKIFASQPVDDPENDGIFHFVEGRSYWSLLVADHGGISTMRVVKRTPKTVLISIDGEEPVRRKVFVDGDVEIIRYGNHSMAPAWAANNVQPEEPAPWNLCPVYDLFTGQRVS